MKVTLIKMDMVNASTHCLRCKNCQLQTSFYQNGYDENKLQLYMVNISSHCTRCKNCQLQSSFYPNDYDENKLQLYKYSKDNKRPILYYLSDYRLASKGRKK